MKLTILHVADIKLDPFSGMGRIAYFWKKAFEEAGHEFIHLGKEEVKTNHPSQFPKQAYKLFRLKYAAKKPDVILAHEPVSGIFIGKNIPVALFSHGIEQREWNLRNKAYKQFHDPVSFKSKILFPVWRLVNCNKGLKKANLLLLSNKEDQSYGIQKYNRKFNDIVIFRNGVKEDFLANCITKEKNGECVIGFAATWIKRKGTGLITKVAKKLADQDINVKWLLFGTVFPKEDILKEFPTELHSKIDIVSTFNEYEEKSLYEKCDIFILPSFFEGQSLALLQGMASGLCCITSDNCAQLDLIQHRINGLLFKTGDFENLSDQIELAINNPKFRNKLGENARESVIDRKWNVVSKEVVRQIEQIA
ncbi:glycosyltransferase family 4 protein [Zunongwangia sp. HGR-M22]|uniref:glycosyltransferase family 4 protein n=1 Tax=Zunongwangia sp. HGR-M22 TaxID=3015168 RepID=UPI0022DD72F5|nr:glycosyltransferase family 4 protein [Zunongwangia sp. HGR-M22]WBL26393.1 glycosyltransferase family 4 protein [Zunongwangia sp. HGR-M22]